MESVAHFARSFQIDLGEITFDAALIVGELQPDQRSALRILFHGPILTHLHRRHAESVEQDLMRALDQFGQVEIASETLNLRRSSSIENSPKRSGAFNAHYSGYIAGCPDSFAAVAF